MIMRVKRNIGFLLAGIVLMGIAFNVWYELRTITEGFDPCQSTLTP